MFLDTPRSTIAGHLHNWVLKLLRTETTTSVSHLEAHLQAAPAEHFPENYDILEQDISRQRPMIMSPSIPAQTLTLK
jgi:hypothetical protein